MWKTIMLLWLTTRKPFEASSIREHLACDDKPHGVSAQTANVDTFPFEVLMLCKIRFTSVFAGLSENSAGMRKIHIWLLFFKKRVLNWCPLCFDTYPRLVTTPLDRSAEAILQLPCFCSVQKMWQKLSFLAGACKQKVKSAVIWRSKIFYYYYY